MNENDTINPVVQVDYYREASRGENISEDNYRGLPVHALPGLHDELAKKIDKYLNIINDEQRTAIEIGAGSGAMSLRLSDMGFKVHAIDYVGENFKTKGDNISFFQLDCNTDFAKDINVKCDLLTAVEIIEHIENPRHFMRKCVELMNDDGVMILTTPNIDSSKSKADFIREGTFNMFRDVSYRTIGHITPICTWQLYKIIEESNLKVLSHTTFANDRYQFRMRPKMFVFQQLIYLLGMKPTWGNDAIHVLVLRKNH